MDRMLEKMRNTPGAPRKSPKALIVKLALPLAAFLALGAGISSPAHAAEARANTASTSASIAAVVTPASATAVVYTQFDNLGRPIAGHFTDQDLRFTITYFTNGNFYILYSDGRWGLYNAAGELIQCGCG